VNRGPWIIAGAIFMAAVLVVGALVYLERRRERSARCEQIAAVLPEAATDLTDAVRDAIPDREQDERLAREFQRLNTEYEALDCPREILSREVRELREAENG
jgi:hypothetical protein